MCGQVVCVYVVCEQAVCEERWQERRREKEEEEAAGRRTGVHNQNQEPRTPHKDVGKRTKIFTREAIGVSRHLKPRNEQCGRLSSH